MKSDIRDLQRKVKEFCEERDWDQFHNPKELAIGLSTEANELLQIFRFKDEEQMRKMLESSERQDIEDELADIFFFVLRFAQMNNIDLSCALMKKIDKNERKYPADLVRGKNLKYNEYTENVERKGKTYE